MKTVYSLGKVCEACGKERKAKNLKYDPETFKPYCDNPYICSPEHPNSPKLLISRGKELDLVDYDTIKVLYEKHLTSAIESDESVQTVHRLLNNPLTLRIQDPEQAKFLVQLNEELKFGNMSEVVRYCIDKLRENRDEYYKDKKKLTEEKEKQAETRQAINELEKFSADENQDEGNDYSF